MKERATVNHIEVKRQNVLTPRQREILELVASGYTNREIANVLDISPFTVIRHLRGWHRSIQGRLGAANQGQAILKAFETGELDLIEIVEKCNLDLERYKKLTVREIEVLENLSDPTQPRENTNIATSMHITAPTVRNFFLKIGGKLGVRKREEMIVFHRAAKLYPFEKSVRQNGLVEKSNF